MNMTGSVSTAWRHFTVQVRGNGATFGLFLAASWGSALLNATYLFIMARFLGVADYGVLLALLSVFVLASLPAAGMDLLTARIFAVLPRNSGLQQSLIRVCGVSGLWGLAAWGIVLALSPVMAPVLSISERGLMLLVAAMVTCSYAQAIGWGILRGKQRFFLLSFNMVLYPLLRIALGLALVWAGLSVLGALLGTLAGTAITAGLALVAGIGRETHLQRPLNSRDSGSEKWVGPKFLGYNFYGVMALIVIGVQALPGTIDVLVVKAMVEPHLAGLYAMAATGGKAGLLLTGAISLFAFPKIVARIDRGLPYADLVWYSLALVGALSGLAALVVGIASPLFVPILFGPDFLPGTSLLRWYAIAVIPFSLLIVLARSYLAADNYGPIKALLVFGVVLAVVLVVVGKEPLWVILAFGAVSLGYLMWAAIAGVKR